MKEKERCSAQVYHPQGWGRFYGCERKAVIERDGKPYCKIHDPEYVAKKGAEKQAQWDKERDERLAVYERRILLAGIFEGIDSTTIKRNFEAYKSAVSSVVHNK